MSCDIVILLVPIIPESFAFVKRPERDLLSCHIVLGRHLPIWEDERIVFACLRGVIILDLESREGLLERGELGFVESDSIHKPRIDESCPSCMGGPSDMPFIHSDPLQDRSYLRQASEIVDIQSRQDPDLQSHPLRRYHRIDGIPEGSASRFPRRTYEIVDFLIRSIQAEFDMPELLELALILIHTQPVRTDDDTDSVVPKILDDIGKVLPEHRFSS